MNYKIVADSSANLFTFPDVDFASVPLKIIAGEKEYVDTPVLDVDQMIDDLKHHKGRSGSSCPNVNDWLEAFGEAECVLAVTISSNLSGSYESAMQAASEYCRVHPECRAHVFDSRSAGPELQLVIEELVRCVRADMRFEDIVAAVEAYQRRSYTLFSLKSMMNLARNGRVHPAAARLAGVLGIHAVGDASPEGTLRMCSKNRGENRAIGAILDEMRGNGFQGGRVRIAHCQNMQAAECLKQRIREWMPESDVEIRACAALCSFYAESGGLILAYEGMERKA